MYALLRPLSPPTIHDNGVQPLIIVRPRVFRGQRVLAPVHPPVPVQMVRVLIALHHAQIRGPHRVHALMVRGHIRRDQMVLVRRVQKALGVLIVVARGAVVHLVRVHLVPVRLMGVVNALMVVHHRVVAHLMVAVAITAAIAHPVVVMLVLGQRLIAVQLCLMMALKLMI